MVARCGWRAAARNPAPPVSLAVVTVIVMLLLTVTSRRLRAGLCRLGELRSGSQFVKLRDRAGNGLRASVLP